MGLAAALKLPKDAFGKGFVDFSVARNGLGKPGGGVRVPVVLRPMPYQHAAHALDLLN